MARTEARNGENFNRVVGKVARNVAIDAVSRSMFDDSADLAYAHASTPSGRADCVAFTSNADSSLGSPVVYLENPELIVLDKLAGKFDRSFGDPAFTTRHTFPLYQIEKGRFTNNTGRNRPSVFRTSEGVVEIQSAISPDERWGAATAEFIPESGNRANTVNAIWEFYA